MSELNIYQRINQIKDAVGHIVKDVEVGAGKSSYKAVSHDMVQSAVNSLMIEHGVVSFVLDIDQNVTREEYTAFDYNTKAPVQKLQTFCVVGTIQRFVNVDSPAEFIDVKSIGHGHDMMDKAAGKALSYSIKYGYMKLFGLSTGENDESRIEKDKANDSIQECLKQIKAATTLGSLKVIWDSLDASAKKNYLTNSAKDAMKVKLSAVNV